MVHEVSLQTEPRQATGKGVGRKLRAKGRIPGVVYGLEKPTSLVTVNRHKLDRLIVESGIHALISLNVGGADEHVMLRETQRDPVTELIVHADFFRVDPNKTVDVDVTIAATGTAIGVRDGGLLEQLRRTIGIRCLPANMPTFLEIDVTNIKMNHSIHIGEIQAPEGVVILTAPETALFTVLAPKKVEEPVAAAAEAEVAEPEVIGKKKAEEEGEKKE